MALLGPATAAEAAGCAGNTCTGKNPHSQGCDQGADVLDRAIPSGGGPRVELRRSKRCSAAWARFDGPANENWRAKLDIQGRKPVIIHASQSYAAYTTMVGTSSRYRACIEEYGGGWTCTKWH
ncbi:DUF2690 domain-containing protein [Streptomyces triculaminicus]|nr:DUF2690 domain-containing protein [Streptomyces triculaminicus]